MSLKVMHHPVKVILLFCFFFITVLLIFLRLVIIILVLVFSLLVLVCVLIIIIVVVVQLLLVLIALGGVEGLEPEEELQVVFVFTGLVPGVRGKWLLLTLRGRLENLLLILFPLWYRL